jgi:peptidoglycan/xylan/chitin deacetylase (PgdA/CDA1 family)
VENFIVKKILAFALLLLCSTPILAKDILISFDGSGYFKMWEDSIAFAQENNIVYTYFISSPYFITESQAAKKPYWALTEIKKLPYCKIMKDRDARGVQRRVNYVLEALHDGHEIASHLCGHYDGSRWTYEQWMNEFRYFDFSMRQAGINPNLHGIWGCRTPYLGVNDAFFRALRDSGYKWSSNKGYSSDPKHIYLADIEIPIREIRIVFGRFGDNGEKIAVTDGMVLPFDDAFDSYVRQNFHTITTLEDNNLVEELEEAYFQSLCWDYLNMCPPTQICLHFAQFPGQPYYNAMKRFVIWVKDKNPNYLLYSEYAAKIRGVDIYE